MPTRSASAASNATRRVWRHIPVVLLSTLILLTAGCPPSTKPGKEPPAVVIPPGVAGTVLEYADLVGGEDMYVQGYGVVIGLGQNGSAEMPDNVRQYIRQLMLRHGIQSHIMGTEALTVDRMLNSKDVAVVVVSGRIPAAAPKGTKFDLEVRALPQSQTLSLDGGFLLSTELRVALTTSAGATADSKVWAVGRGEVFLNPFMDRAKERANLKVGRILNGGTVSTARSVALSLRRSDWRIANVIQRRAHQRFGGTHVAVAKSATLVELQIPKPYQEDYRHFLELVMHVYLNDGPGADEQYAKQLARTMELPTALYEDISLVWEAMGRQMLPVIRKLYAAPDPHAAFFATRAGVRLEDPDAVESMIRIASEEKGRYQTEAIRQLGRARQFVQAIPPLKRMLADDNELVRVAAYEALLDHGYTGVAKRLEIPDRLTFDLVAGDKEPVIYVTRTGDPKIVLFGSDLALRRPFYYCRSDDMIELNAPTKAGDLMARRKIPISGRLSDPLAVSPVTIEGLIRTLGSPPERTETYEIAGLGLTYSQVAGVLYEVCRSGSVPARFVLQQSPELQRIYMSTPAGGRPDTPEEDEATPPVEPK